MNKQTTNKRLKTLALATLMSSVTLAAPAAFAGDKGKSKATGQTAYPQESQKSFLGPDNLFTGDVNVQMLFPNNDTAHYSGAYVTFAAGARTNWHSHPAGQHMVITSGTGLTGTRDGKIIELKEGDALWCPPNIDHWHGATADTAMTHLVLTGSLKGENVTWKEKVTDKQYNGGK